jgi:hypothetical protein
MTDTGSDVIGISNPVISVNRNVISQFRHDKGDVARGIEF